jgi:hypothetical protein
MSPLVAAAKAQPAAEATAKLEAEAKATQEAEAKAKQEAEAKAKQEAEAKAKQAAEAKAKQEAEAKANRSAMDASMDDDLALDGDWGDEDVSLGELLSTVRVLLHSTFDNRAHLSIVLTFQSCPPFNRAHLSIVLTFQGLTFAQESKP